MDGTSESSMDVGQRLAQEHNMPGYERETAYAAAQALFDQDETVVDAYISPLEALDSGSYDGNAPVDAFEERFQKGLKAYDSRTGGEYEPEEGGLYDGLDDELLDRQEPVKGADIANAFLAADTYEAARTELERFERWMKPTLDQTELQFDEDKDPLQPEEYHHAVIMHSFQRLIQRKHANQDSEQSEQFEPPEGGRNIDLASRL